MKKIAMLLLTVGGFFLAACTTGHEKRMAELHVGQPVNGFIAKAGAPTSTRENSDGSKVLTWESRRRIDGFYGTHWTECVVTVAVTPAGLISRYRARGPDCRT